MSSDTKYILKNDIPIKILPIVRNTKEVISKIFPATINWSSTCFRIGTILLFADRIL